LAFLEQLQRQGKVPQQLEQYEDQLQKIGAGVQPRGARAPLLLGDFKFNFFSVQRHMASARSFNMFQSMLHMGLID